MASNNPFVWAANNPDKLFSVLYSDEQGRYRTLVLARTGTLAMDIVREELKHRLPPCRVLSAKPATIDQLGKERRV